MTEQADESKVAADAMFGALCRRLIARIAEADAPNCAEPIDLELKLHCIILERNELRSSLTARDELLRDAMPPSSTDYNLIAREDWYSKRDAIYGPRPSAVPKAPIPKHLDTQDDWMDNDD